MLGKFVNMAELSRQMGLNDGQKGLAADPLLQVGQGGLAGAKSSGGGPKGVRNVGNVHAAPLSDLELCGVRLEQRAQLVRIAQPLLDRGLLDAEVHAALIEYAACKQWAPLSRAMLEGIVESAIDELVEAEMAEDAAQQAASLALGPDELQEVSLADIRPEPVRWLWPGKIPLGKVTVIYGEAGIGKTCLALDLAARVSAGTKLLDGSSSPEAGHVLIVNGEDPLVDAICPRLVGGGANLQRLSVIAGMKSSAPQGAPAGSPQGSVPAATGERSFDLGRDLPVLRRRIAASGQIRLVIIDPLEAYCGKSGLNRARLRDVMAELTKLAADTGVAVVVISSATKCDLPVKNVWRVDCDLLDAGVRIWVPVRYNYGPLPEGLAFRVTETGLAWESRSQGPTADRGRGASAKQERCTMDPENWTRK